MTERQAVKVRRIMFLVVDAGRGVSGDFAQRIEGPTGIELVYAAASTAIDASVRLSYAAFSSQLNEWSGRVKRWRCGLSATERARLASARTGVAATSPSSSTGSASTSSAPRGPASSRLSRPDLDCRRNRSTS